MLKNIFVSEVRISVLRQLLNNPNEQYHIRDIVRKVGAEINAVRRELINLSDLGILRKRQSGNRIYFKADITHNYYSELLALVNKEYSLGETLTRNLKSLGNVKFIVISTAFLSGRKPTVMDVDLFVVGDINLEVLKKIIVLAERNYNTEINYSTMTEQDFLLRKRKNDHFINRLLSQSRSMLVGNEDEFCNLD